MLRLTSSYCYLLGRVKNVTNKVEMLRGRDLKRYANQLRITKSKCENRITQLGKYILYITADCK